MPFNMDVNDISFYNNVEFTTFVYNFVKQCKEKFNKEVEVIPSRPGLLKEHLLVEAADEILYEFTKDRTKHVKSKCREKHIVFMRQSAVKLLTDNGAKKLEIAKLLHQDRTTIIHSLKIAKELIEVRHKEFLDIYNRLLSLYTKKNENYISSLIEQHVDSLCTKQTESLEQVSQ